MFFMEIKEYGDSYRIYYYKTSEHSKNISEYAYKTTDLDKSEISVSNAIMHRIFYYMSDKYVYIPNYNTIEYAIKIFGKDTMSPFLSDSSKKLIVCDKYLEWCKEKSQTNNNLKIALEKFDKSLRLKTVSIAQTIAAYNYLEEFIDEYFDSINNEANSEESISNLKTTKHYLIDLDTVNKFNFFDKYTVNSDDKIVLFLSKDKNFSFSSVKPIINFANNIEIIINDEDNASTETKIYTYLVANNNPDNELNIVTENKIFLNSLEYLTSNALTNINIIYNNIYVQDDISIVSDDIFSDFDCGFIDISI